MRISDWSSDVCSSDLSVNAGAEWTIPFGGDNSLQLRADFALLSKFFFEPGEGNAIYGTTTPLAVQPSYGLLDLRANARIGNFRVSAFVMNATDTYYRSTVLAVPGQLVGYPGARSEEHTSEHKS